MLIIPILLAAAVGPSHANHGAVYLKGQRFVTELCITDDTRMRGMMHRPSMAPDQAMFFYYSEDLHHTIWMKNCLIPLDVAWIKADGTIVEVATQVPPCSPMMGDNCPNYGGKVASRHFVEFQAGTFKRLGVKVGDRMGWELKAPSGQALKGGALPAAKKP